MVMMYKILAKIVDNFKGLRLLLSPHNKKRKHSTRLALKTGKCDFHQFPSISPLTLKVTTKDQWNQYEHVKLNYSIVCRVLKFKQYSRHANI